MQVEGFVFLTLNYWPSYDANIIVKKRYSHNYWYSNNQCYSHTFASVILQLNIGSSIKSSPVTRVLTQSCRRISHKPSFGIPCNTGGCPKIWKTLRKQLTNYEKPVIWKFARFDIDMVDKFWCKKYDQYDEFRNQIKNKIGHNWYCHTVV